MTNIISYMSITQGLSDNFYKIKKSLENDLKPLLEKIGTIKFDKPININFYNCGNQDINEIIIGGEGYALLCNKDNNIYQYITTISDIDDFYNLCVELGM
jgi:hypothetical protein